jgi:hypothetical protein
VTIEFLIIKLPTDDESDTVRSVAEPLPLQTPPPLGNAVIVESRIVRLATDEFVELPSAEFQPPTKAIVAFTIKRF